MQRDVKRICKDFEIKNLGEYHELYTKGDTLLLANISENFRKRCSKTYELDPAKLLSASELAQIEKEVRGGQKILTNIWKIMIKNKELSHLKYWDVNDLYRWAMSQKLQVNIFE